MRPPRAGTIVMLALLAWAVGVAAAQGGLAYTVQVAALSDPESAIRQSGTLLRDGFPAYVVRAEGQAGTVFRVRVGAFGDRASADRYARTMGERAGGTPRPALAEAIPAGILPLAPTVVADVAPGRRAVLLPWEEGGMILRIGPEGAPARYEPLGGGTAFEAIWARPVSAGGGRRGSVREEIAQVPLDGEATEDEAPEVREALFRQRLRLMSDRSGLAEEALASAVRGEPGSRHLVAWRSTDDAGTIHGVLAAGADPASRDSEAWLGEVPPAPPAPLAVLAEAEAIPDAESVAPGDAAPDVATPAAGGAEDPDAEADGAPARDEGAESPADGPSASVDAGASDLPAGDADPDDATTPEAPDDDAASVDATTEHDAVGAVGEAEGDAEAAPAPSQEDTATVSGDGWTAVADGTWTVLRVGDVAWRALVGTPRAGVGDVLVLDVGDALEVVRLVPR